jgi:exopolysaccharide biosynthesis protein
VKKLWQLGLLLGAVLLVGVFIVPHTMRTRSEAQMAAAVPPRYEAIAKTRYVAHILTIAPSFTVRPFLAETTLTVEQVAAKTNAIAVINAGFFDPINQKTTSTVLMDGQLVATPKDNERLVNNPKLAPYLNAILNRSEFRVYQCGSQVRYGIDLRSAPIPDGCRLAQAVGGGPQLLPKNTSQLEGFTAYVKGELIRDAIGGTQPNARSAIGLKPDGTVIWVMVAQTLAQPSGMTLDELADFMKRLGVTSALNLDGGTSSSMYVQGNVLYGKRDEAGQPIKRAVKSALLLLKVQ